MFSTNLECSPFSLLQNLQMTEKETKREKPCTYLFNLINLYIFRLQAVVYTFYLNTFYLLFMSQPMYSLFTCRKCQTCPTTTICFTVKTINDTSIEQQPPKTDTYLITGKVKHIRKSKQRLLTSLQQKEFSVQKSVCSSLYNKKSSLFQTVFSHLFNKRSFVFQTAFTHLFT